MRRKLKHNYDGGGGGGGGGGFAPGYCGISFSTVHYYYLDFSRLLHDLL